MTDTRTLDPEHVALVAAIARGATQAEAAALLGCSERTIRRRLTEDAVRAALDAERVRVGTEVADLLSSRARAAVERLGRVIETGEDRHAVNAARVLLSETRQHRDQTMILDRLEAVEDAITERGA